MPLFPDFKPGLNQVSADQMQEISEALARSTGAVGGQGNNTMNVAGGAVQNQAPNDNFWIMLTAGPGTNGGGAKAAPYVWQEVQRDGTAFADLSHLQHGTLTLNPAYEQNGKRDVPIPSVVRAWQAIDTDGSACMEFDAGAGAIDPCCPVYGGVYGDDCRCDPCGCDGGGGGGTTGCKVDCVYGTGTFTDLAGNVWTTMPIPPGLLHPPTASLLWCGSGDGPANGPVLGSSLRTYTDPGGFVHYLWDGIYDVQKGACVSGNFCCWNVQVVGGGTLPGGGTSGGGIGGSVGGGGVIGGIGGGIIGGGSGTGGGGIGGIIGGIGGGIGGIIGTIFGDYDPLQGTNPPVTIEPIPGWGGPNNPPVLPGSGDGGGVSLPYPPSPKPGGNLLWRGGEFPGFYGGSQTYGGGLLVLPTEGGMGTVTPGTSGNVLTSDGTNWVSSPSAGASGQTVTDTISANQNDYAFGGMTAVAGDNVVVLSSSGVGPWDITGIAISQTARTRLIIIKTATAPNVILRHNSASSSSPNKMRLGNAALDITLTGDKTVSFIYDDNQGNWKLTANSG